MHRRKSVSYSFIVIEHNAFQSTQLESYIKRFQNNRVYCWFFKKNSKGIFTLELSFLRNRVIKHLKHRILKLGYLHDMR